MPNRKMVLTFGNMNVEGKMGEEIKINNKIYKDTTNSCQPNLVYIPTSKDYLGNLNCMMFDIERKEVLGIYSLKKADIENGRFTSVGDAKMKFYVYN